jgi:hypothetical protein
MKMDSDERELLNIADKINELCDDDDFIKHLDRFSLTLRDVKNMIDAIETYAYSLNPPDDN